MKTRSVPRHLWPSDHQRVDHAGNALHAAAAAKLEEFRAQGMPADLAGALKWIAEHRQLDVLRAELVDDAVALVIGQEGPQ